MIDLAPFDPTREKAEEWLVKLSRLLQENPYLEQLLEGKLVPKSQKSTYLTGLSVSGGAISLDGAVTINESGADADMRVESDGNTAMLFVDGGANRVGVGTDAPTTTLDVNDPLAPSIVRVGGTSGIAAVDLNGAGGYGTLKMSTGRTATSGPAGTYSLIESGANDGIIISMANTGTAISFYLNGTRLLRMAGNGLIIADLAGAYTAQSLYNSSGVLYWNGPGDAAGRRILLNSDAYGTTQIGGASNYSEFEADGTLQFVGNATVWEDLRVEPTVRAAAGAGVPAREEWFDATGLNVTTAGVGDLHLYSFTDEAVAGNEKEIRFTVQFPHSWAGTAVSPHVHWVGAVADTTAEPRWGLQYSWADIGENFPGTSTVYTTGAKIGAGGAADNDVTAGRHYISEFADITPSASQNGISAILIGRLFRNSSDAGDTYNAAGATCGLLGFDIHYEVNTVGSRSEYVK